MNRRRFIHTSALGLGIAPAWSAERAPLAAFTPKERHEMLVNPGMGYETFFCFNSDKHVVIDKTRRPTKGHGDYKYPPASIAYFRFLWHELEPVEGQYNFALLDEHLAKARANGQQLSTRFQAFHTNTCPDWYQKKAKHSYTIVSRRSEKELRRFNPDYRDADFLQRQEALAIAFAEPFNGHPDLAYIDIGHIGNAGEWHTGNTSIIENGVDTKQGVPMPEPAQYQHLIDLYCKHWNKTLLHINEQSHEIGALEYALKHGVGWRYDGWGFAGVTAEFPKVLASIGGTDAWKTAPVRFECCEPEKWKTMPLDLFRQQHEFALSLHMSGGHGKMLQLTDDKWEVVYDFVRRCGYRFVCTRADVHSLSATKQRLSLQFTNRGVVPVYRDYLLAARISTGDQTHVVKSNANLRTWLPGDHTTDLEVELPGAFPKGPRKLSLAILDPITSNPTIKFANEGRQQDGWHFVGEWNA